MIPKKSSLGNSIEEFSGEEIIVPWEKIQEGEIQSGIPAHDILKMILYLCGEKEITEADLHGSQRKQVKSFLKSGAYKALLDKKDILLSYKLYLQAYSNRTTYRISDGDILSTYWDTIMPPYLYSRQTVNDGEIIIPGGRDDYTDILDRRDTEGFHTEEIRMIEVIPQALIERIKQAKVLYFLGPGNLRKELGTIYKAYGCDRETGLDENGNHISTFLAGKSIFIVDISQQAINEAKKIINKKLSYNKHSAYHLMQIKGVQCDINNLSQHIQDNFNSFHSMQDTVVFCLGGTLFNNSPKQIHNILQMINNLSPGRTTTYFDHRKPSQNEEQELQGYDSPVDRKWTMNQIRFLCYLTGLDFDLFTTQVGRHYQESGAYTILRSATYTGKPTRLVIENVQGIYTGILKTNREIPIMGSTRYDHNFVKTICKPIFNALKYISIPSSRYIEFGNKSDQISGVVVTPHNKVVSTIDRQYKNILLGIKNPITVTGTILFMVLVLLLIQTRTYKFTDNTNTTTIELLDTLADQSEEVSYTISQQFIDHYCKEGRNIITGQDIQSHIFKCIKAYQLYKIGGQLGEMNFYEWYGELFSSISEGEDIISKYPDEMNHYWKELQKVYDESIQYNLMPL